MIINLNQFGTGGGGTVDSKVDDVKVNGVSVVDAQKTANIDSAFDVTSIATGYNAAMISAANPNTINTEKRGQFISGWNNQSLFAGTLTSGNGNINGTNNGVVMGGLNKVNESGITNVSTCSTVLGRSNIVENDTTTYKGGYDFVQGYQNNLKTKGYNYVGGSANSVAGAHNSVFGNYGKIVGDYNYVANGATSEINGNYNFIVGSSNQIFSINLTKIGDKQYITGAEKDVSFYYYLLNKLPFRTTNSSSAATITDYTATLNENGEVIITSTVDLPSTIYLFTNYVNGTRNICGNGFAKGTDGIALGNMAQSLNTNTVAIGRYAVAHNTNEIALGFCNYSQDDTYFSIGNGTNYNYCHNIFEIKNNGNVILNDGTCIQDKFNEIELSKVPNVTIFGAPTIQNGQVSNFSTINYLQFPFLVDLTNKSFEINMCFTTGNDVTTQQNIFDSNFGLAFAIKNGSFIAAISSNGTSWNSGELEGYSVVLPNTTYYYKIKGVYEEGYTMYQFLVSEDNITFTEDIESAVMASPYPRHIVIGKSVDNTHIFKGSINLNNCNVIVNDIELWRGMDSVGLATRLSTDLSNIDESGKEKIKEIVAEDFRPLIIHSSANTTAGSYQVPQLTDTDIVNAYNAVIIGRAVIIVDKNDTMHAFVNQADTLNNEISIGILYYSYALLTYTLSDSTVSITVKEIS